MAQDLREGREEASGISASEVEMSNKPKQLPPFEDPFRDPSMTSPDQGATEFEELLPASFRGVGGKEKEKAKDKDIIFPATQRIEDFIKNELNLDKLDAIFDKLWLVGRPMPPRPLHYQLQSSREIYLTEKMEQHLVWTNGRMYLKPIPRFLFCPDFWDEHFSCEEDTLCRNIRPPLPKPQASEQQQPWPCDRCKLWRRALGFLHSYTALISYESDFYIAKDKHLLPEELKWDQWRIFVKELLGDKGIDIYNDIDRRFIYGELRLSRLNKIYWTITPFKGFMSRWDQYGVFWEENFTILATSTVYMAIVLTAMQLGLATDMLKDNEAFHRASYGFTVFSVMGPLCFAALIFVGFLYLFVNNFFATIAYRKRRFINIKDSLNPP